MFDSLPVQEQAFYSFNQWKLYCSVSAFSCSWVKRFLFHDIYKLAVLVAFSCYIDNFLRKLLLYYLISCNADLNRRVKYQWLRTLRVVFCCHRHELACLNKLSLLLLYPAKSNIQITVSVSQKEQKSSSFLLNSSYYCTTSN